MNKVRKMLALCACLTFAAAQTHALTDDEKNEEGKKQFAGLSFGAGVSLTLDTGDNSRVGAASEVDGILRIEDENDKIARVMLESHYFFTPDKKFLNLKGLGKDKWGWGPFVALQPGNEEIIEAIAMGLMIGFRRPNDATGSSWNFGIGYVTDPNVKVLGDGFQANQPLPGNETTVRLKEISQDGIVLLFSFSF